MSKSEINKQAWKMFKNDMDRWEKSQQTLTNKLSESLEKAMDFIEAQAKLEVEDRLFDEEGVLQELCSCDCLSRVFHAREHYNHCKLWKIYHNYNKKELKRDLVSPQGEKP